MIERVQNKQKGETNIIEIVLFILVEIGRKEGGGHEKKYRKTKKQKGDDPLKKV